MNCPKIRLAAWCLVVVLPIGLLGCSLVLGLGDLVPENAGAEAADGGEDSDAPL